MSSAVEFTYDRDASSVVPVDKSLSGTYGGISFSRLCEALEASGEIRGNERITHLVIGAGGIRYRVERRTP